MTLFELLPSVRHGLNPHLDRAVWPLSAYVDDLGRLCVGDVAADDIAAEYGTPIQVVDEEDFRARIRCYRATLPDAELIYGGKALLSVDVARWAADEGAGVKVCSAAELATALAADVPPQRIVLAGAKTATELGDPIAAGVGRIVIDSPSEISLLACRVGHRQRVLVRVIPDVGTPDQKFGFALSGGQAALRRVVDQPSLDLVGLHCQLGAQLTDASLYGAAIRQMIGVMAEVREHHQVVLTELNLGGGHAIPHRSGEPELNLRSLGATVDAALESACAEHGFPRPKIVIEPGRAIAARAGVTLCRITAVKRQPGGHTFVAVDGGPAGNRRGLGAKYTVALANRHRPTASAPVTVVGRNGHGDEIARDVELPADIHPGDLLAVACTGAYQHSTVSSLSLVGRPPLVAVSGGRSRELVRRETVADLLARDRGWNGQ
ncbi:diaminopimelate decarboxylase family protein [Mycobacterium paraffinicum]|uniref:Diaminopimelate decarboxylase n=1 Tax=Mycobacterium paraffinicum TaxID=53378 RepID=A0ABP8F4U2_9MYCO|nr:diaminopimelate decarboxylase [Mycobacterium paraffinicum]MCV7311057.1 diaminopimelate decarboxylase [Mycobacterium paraffinicum]